MMDRPWIFMCAGGNSMSSLIKKIKYNNPQKTIYGLDADINNSNKKLFNKFYTIPLPNDDNFISTLLNILKNIGPSMLIPGADEEAIIISSYKDILTQNNILCNVMDHKTVTSIVDKLYLNTNIIEANPNYAVKCIRVYNNIDFRETCIKMGYPSKKIILKPITGRGRRSTYIVSEEYFENKIKDSISHIKMDDAIKEKLIISNNMMVMEYVEGESITIDVLGSKGKIVHTTIRKWNEKWRFPFPGQKIISDKNIDGLIKVISKIINLHGLIDIDAIKTEEGRIVFLEINPRPSGSVAVSEIAGIPIFSMLEKVLEGKDINKVDLKIIKEIDNI